MEYYMPGINALGVVTVAAAALRLPLHPGASGRGLALAVAPWDSRLQPGARSIVLRKAAVRSDGRVTACEQVTSNYKTGHCRLHFGGCPMKICPDLRAANSIGPHATHQRTRFGSQWFVNGLNEDLCGCYFWHISRWIKRRDRCPSG